MYTPEEAAVMAPSVFLNPLFRKGSFGADAVAGTGLERRQRARSRLGAGTANIGTVNLLNPGVSGFPLRTVPCVAEMCC